MPEQFESKTEKNEKASASSKAEIESSAKLLDRDAAKFLSSGSEKAANALLSDLRDIADKGGPTAVKDVFRQVAADSTAWKTLTKATVSESGDFITFQPAFVPGLVGYNFRAVSASLRFGTAKVTGEIDRNHLMGLGKMRRLTLEK